MVDKNYKMSVDELYAGFGFLMSCEFTETEITLAECVEKQMPKRPAYQGEHEKCPTCGSFGIVKFCSNCGQKIDLN